MYFLPLHGIHSKVLTVSTKYEFKAHSFDLHSRKAIYFHTYIAKLLSSTAIHWSQHSEEYSEAIKNWTFPCLPTSRFFQQLKTSEYSTHLFMTWISTKATMLCFETSTGDMWKDSIRFRICVYNSTKIHVIYIFSEIFEWKTKEL